MSKITVYRFTAWDNLRGESLLSSRMATLDGIKQHIKEGAPVEGSGVEIEDTLIDPYGMTDRDFQP